MAKKVTHLTEDEVRNLMELAAENTPSACKSHLVYEGEDWHKPVLIERSCTVPSGEKKCRTVITITTDLTPTEAREWKSKPMSRPCCRKSIGKHSVLRRPP